MQFVTNNVNSFIEKHTLIPSGSSLIVGLSGGPDSVFLLNFLVENKKKYGIKNIIAAHLNHEWRSDSDQDVRVCQSLCDTLHVPLVVKKLSDYKNQIKSDGSKEAYARTARRSFFQEVRKKYHADFIALAHHLQDQEETFFIRLVRGSSLSGLVGIWPKSGDYIRPLLEANKKDIVQYLDQNNIAYLTDPTNISPEFLRNRIRTNVIPALQKCDPRFDQNFITTINRLQDTERFLQNLTGKTFDTISTDTGINLSSFFEQPLLMQYRILMQWIIASKVPFTPTQALLDELIRFLKQPGSKTHTIHETFHIIKSKGFATIRQ